MAMPNVTEIFVKLSLKLMLLKNHEKIGIQQSFSKTKDLAGFAST